MSVEKQIAIIYCGTRGLLSNVPVGKIKEFEEEFLHQMEVRHRDVLDKLQAGKLDEQITSTIETLAKEISSQYSSGMANLKNVRNHIGSINSTHQIHKYTKKISHA